MVQKPLGDRHWRQRAQFIEKGRGRHTGYPFKSALPFCIQARPFALELGNQLIARQGVVRIIRHITQLARQLGKGDLRVDHHRLHLCHILDGGKELHGIKDAEGLFAQFRTEPGSTAQHLVKENAAVHAAQKDQIANFRHINAGGE